MPVLIENVNKSKVAFTNINNSDDSRTFKEFENILFLFKQLENCLYSKTNRVESKRKDLIDSEIRKDKSCEEID